LNFLDRLSEKKALISSYINIRPVTAELFHTDRQTDRRTDGHDEANRSFCNFANTPKKHVFILLSGTDLRQ
jgi:hypothetical protein